MANFNEQCICIKLCLKLRKTPSDMQETKSVFTVMTQQANISHVSGKTITIHVRRKWGESGQTPGLCWLTFLTEDIVHQKFVPPCYMVN